MFCEDEQKINRELNQTREGFSFTDILCFRDDIKGFFLIFIMNLDRGL